VRDSHAKHQRDHAESVVWQNLAESSSVRVPARPAAPPSCRVPIRAPPPTSEQCPITVMITVIDPGMIESSALRGCVETNTSALTKSRAHLLAAIFGPLGISMVLPDAVDGRCTNWACSAPRPSPPTARARFPPVVSASRKILRNDHETADLRNPRIARIHRRRES